MKKWLYILAAIFFQIQFVSCMDEQLVDGSSESDMTSLKIVLDIPVENAQSRGLVYGPDEEASEKESEINDIYAIAFDSDNKCVDKFRTTYSSGTLSATIDLAKTEADKPLTVMVLTNLKNLENGNSLVSALDGMIGKTKEQVLKELKYTFSQAWNITERQLPMWGETSITPIKNKIVNGNVTLYRAVSKINVTVNKGQGVHADDGTDIFKLKSVRVYYARTSGLAGSLHAPVTNEEGGSPTIITPSMPADVGYMPRYKNNDGVTSNGILFENTSGNDYALENQIYVPEVEQPGEQPMCLVVGGYYLGSSEETFYRVDFKAGNKGDTYYDALRNHIYNFDITGVKRPGTDDHDPALDHVVVGMDVTITEWTTEYMRGIGGQYTLEVEAGGVLMDASNQSGSSLWVETTHNAGWNIEAGSKEGDWYTVTKADDKVVIIPDLNKGGQRRGSFVITSGNLRKVIMVRQKGKEEGAANCYVVSDDGTKMWQDLIVTVKGNGEEGLLADGKTLVDQQPNIAPTDVKIIWETAEGLVTLKKDPATPKTIISKDGIVQFQIDLSKQNTNIANSNQKNLKGGNALIGAFNDSGELLWSWHLWVCPDMDQDRAGDKGYGIIDASELAAHLQTWSTGYNFMDRNLGALSNKPGLASLGLLYQWGRKDPFIGVGKITKNADPMYTKLYHGFSWTNRSSMSVEDARKAPTTLSGSKLSGADYALLWGTDKGFSPDGERDAGNKTIYDPCPAGYRVPPVGSVVFKSESGKSSSEDTNWDNNNVYWPYIQNISGSGSKNYKSDTDSYGFWVNLENGYKKPQNVPYYTDSRQNNAESIAGATWLPISGVYDGNMNSFAKIDNQWSVTVNSIVWTNSSITVNSSNRPGALFLHGTEDWSLSHNTYNSGRHIHKLIEPGTSNSLYAKPSHAGSVRCIKDDKSSIRNSIKVPETVTLGANKGSVVTATLVSITETWEVVNPGASWFTMTPDEGGTGSAQEITFRATENNTGEQREATLIIKFSDNTERSIKVIQKGISHIVSKNSLTFAGYKNRNNRPSTQTVGITIEDGSNWTASSNQDWLEISYYDNSYYYDKEINDCPSYYRTLYVRLESNANGRTRTGTITVKTTTGRTETITVTQGTNKE